MPWSWCSSSGALEESPEAVETGVYHLLVGPHPRRLRVEAMRAESARAHPADLLRGHETRLLEHPHMLLHAREGHVEGRREVADRRVPPPESVEDATAGRVRDCRE